MRNALRLLVGFCLVLLAGPGLSQEGYLGISGEYLPADGSFLVAGINPRGPARGLLEVGDRLTAFDGVAFDQQSELDWKQATVLEVGKGVAISLVRAEKERIVRVVPAAYPEAILAARLSRDRQLQIMAHAEKIGRFFVSRGETEITLVSSGLGFRVTSPEMPVDVRVAIETLAAKVLGNPPVGEAAPSPPEKIVARLVASGPRLELQLVSGPPSLLGAPASSVDRGKN